MTRGFRPPGPVGRRMPRSLTSRQVSIDIGEWHQLSGIAKGREVASPGVADESRPSPRQRPSFPGPSRGHPSQALAVISRPPAGGAPAAATWRPVSCIVPLPVWRALSTWAASGLACVSQLGRSFFGSRYTYGPSSSWLALPAWAARRLASVAAMGRLRSGFR